MKKNQLHPRTAIINVKQKNHCRLARRNALQWLTEQFPKAFDTTVQIYPLSIGVMDDILSYAKAAELAGISKSKLRQAIVVFTRRIDYLASLKSGGVRVNLQGESCGIVTEEQALAAALKIKKRVEKNIRNHRHSSFLEAQVARTAAEPLKYRHVEREHELAPKKTEIVFKNKTTKTVDPKAVERLKSKLGLGLRKQEFIE
ncbi:MAG: activator of prop osmoprotectant transporter [Gammaproteobacteria bacterium]|nr:activator of prop osmoprotectant transporter [Gammaproteobacteria bacterium]